MENSNVYKTYTLLIVFKTIPKIGIAVSSPKRKIIIGDKIYLESVLGEFNGHYDWLVNHSGKIIGVRYFVFEELEFLCSKFENFTYCEVDNQTIKIYFSDDREVDEENSIDQDFSGDRIFYSDNLELVMSFYIEGKNKQSLFKNIKYDYGDFFEI